MTRPRWLNILVAETWRSWRSPALACTLRSIRCYMSTELVALLGGRKKQGITPLQNESHESLQLWFLLSDVVGVDFPVVAIRIKTWRITLSFQHAFWVDNNDNNNFQDAYWVNNNDNDNNFQNAFWVNKNNDNNSQDALWVNLKEEEELLVSDQVFAISSDYGPVELVCISLYV